MIHGSVLFFPLHRLFCCRSLTLFKYNSHWNKTDFLLLPAAPRQGYLFVFLLSMETSWCWVAAIAHPSVLVSRMCWTAACRQKHLQTRHGGELAQLASPDRPVCGVCVGLISVLFSSVYSGVTKHRVLLTWVWGLVTVWDCGDKAQCAPRCCHLLPSPPGTGGCVFTLKRGVSSANNPMQTKYWLSTQCICAWMSASKQWDSNHYVRCVRSRLLIHAEKSEKGES